MLAPVRLANVREVSAQMIRSPGVAYHCFKRSASAPRMCLKCGKELSAHEG